MVGDPTSKYEKQKNALIYATEQYSNIGRTKLMKFIFFIDLISYNDSGDTILEDCYKRVPYGPAPSTGMILTDDDSDLFEIEVTEFEPNKIIKNFRSREKCDNRIFSKDEIFRFNQILRVLRQYPAEKISDITHELTLWKDYKNGDTIPKERLKLDDEDYFEFLSLIAYHEAR
jgi:uncharacterized phage-associated protein